MLLGCSMTSFALFDKIKKEIKWREEEKPRFNQVKVTIDGKEKMRKVIPGRYEIKLFEITYPTDLFGKNRFYNEFNAFLKNIKKGKKYSLLLEERFYQEMQDIKVDQLSEEEKILELPASSLDEYYRQQIIAMSNGVNLTEYVGTDQEYLNRQIYVLYELLNKTDFNPSNVYSELDKEFLIEELKNNRKEVVENFEKSNVEFFIKETYENSGLNKFKDKIPFELSGGQKQRLLIGIAYLSGRDIIVFDEPTSGLDGFHMKIIADLFRYLAEKGKTIIVITHDIEFTAEVADTIIYMSKGKIQYHKYITNENR